MAYKKVRQIHPLSSASPTLPPKEEARLVFTVFASVAKQSPGRVKVYGGIYSSLGAWDISLTLNMTEDPLSALRATSPEGGSKVSFYRLCVNVERANLLARVCERRYS